MGIFLFWESSFGILIKDLCCNKMSTTFRCWFKVIVWRSSSVLHH